MRRFVRDVGAEMTDERMSELLSKLEEATTDGDLSSLTADDIGDIYSWMLEQQNKAQGE